MQRIEYYSEAVIRKFLDYFDSIESSYRKPLLERIARAKKTGRESDETMVRQTIREVSESRYQYLSSQLKEPVLTDVLYMAVAQYLYPEFYHMIRKITGQGVTLQLALRINHKEHCWTQSQLKGGYEILRRILKVEHRSENFLYSSLYADERLALYLAGDDYAAEEIKRVAELYFPYEDNRTYYAVETYVEKVRAVFEKMKNTRGYIFQMAGENGRGKRSILKELAKREETGWVFVDTQKLSEQKRDRLEQFMWLIHREAFFYEIGICFYHVKPDKTWKNIEYLLEMMIYEYGNYVYPITVCTDENVELIPFVSVPVYRMVLPECSRNERIAVWKGLSKEYHLELDSEKYGIKYSLNPGDIWKILKNFTIGGKISHEEDIDTRIADLCMETRATPGKGSIHRIHSEYKMEDLMLEDKQKQVLQYICAYIKKSHQVYDEWNMGRKFSYGRGVTALFYGPPGTGKTMGAYVLSNELKIPLYRVDLSQVVDKYIGETEKHLEEIFTYAQKSNVILFFDEADSIFGKRTEVKDSKDKYANTEVSFILQRIEEYDGIVILATNYRNNIDDAFMRRMKYAVEFRMPDKQTRKNIWIHSFSREIPLEHIDYDYLADKVVLSGGYIKNIILNAVFQAASEDSEVTMKHIISSVRNEYMKLGKVLTPQDLEKYAYYFDT